MIPKKLWPNLLLKYMNYGEKRKSLVSCQSIILNFKLELIITNISVSIAMITNDCIENLDIYIFYSKIFLLLRMFSRYL